MGMQNCLRCGKSAMHAKTMQDGYCEKCFKELIEANEEKLQQEIQKEHCEFSPCDKCGLGLKTWVKDKCPIFALMQKVEALKIELEMAKDKLSDSRAMEE